MKRKIIHLDMDAFYASVEQRDNPELLGKPVIVGAPPEARGVVSTASYEAREFGLRSAMATSRAYKLCPEVILVRPNFEKYNRISNQIFAVYQEYTDIIEPLSLDECFLDVTENKKNISSATEIARHLKEEIKKETGLIVSAGVSVNKLLAKIASDYDKPDGLFVIKPDDIDVFMKQLPVNKLFGVGKVAFSRLKKMNILSCGDLQKYTLVEMIKNFGVWGEQLYYFCRGIDDRPVIMDYDIKSIGSERTLPIDTNNLKMIKEMLYEEVKIIVSRLTKKELKAKTITIKVKYDNFTQVTRSKSLAEHTSEFVIIYEICLNLLAKTDIPARKIRLIGASLSNFESNNEQLELDFYS